MLILAESSHPIFRATSALERRDFFFLKKKEVERRLCITMEVKKLLN